MSRVIPSQKMPEIDVPLAGGGRWKLSENAPDFMLMIDIYRGYHCPRCKQHLEAAAARRDELREIGVEIVAISTDPPERAEKSVSEWAVEGIPFGHSLSIETARALGLYISKSLADHEIDTFAEPGVFFVKSDLTLYGAVINTFPFARPQLEDLIEVAKIHKARDYPARGTLAAQGARS